MTKPPKWHMHPAKTQISLHICPVWSFVAVCMKKAWVLSYPLSAQWRHWSDQTDAQGDLSLRWAHSSFCWFCHEAAQLLVAGWPHITLMQQAFYRLIYSKYPKKHTSPTTCITILDLIPSNVMWPKQWHDMSNWWQCSEKKTTTKNWYGLSIHNLLFYKSKYGNVVIY